MRTYPSSPDEASIEPVKFHDTRHTVQLWSVKRDISCISNRDAATGSLQ